MTYPYGGPNQYPPQSSAAYGAYWPQSAGNTNQRASRANPLAWAVLVLGLATYIISCAAGPAPGASGWGVRFATSAALVAALGLLPRQSAHTKLMAALAVMGFLEALPQLIIGHHNPCWAMIVIAAVNALQALTAIAALAPELRVPRADNSGLAPYEAYAYYSQVAQQYYAANNQQLQQQSAQSQATAQADAAAPAQAQESQDTDAKHYALYAEYLGANQSGPNPAASPQPGGGTQAAQPGTGMPRTGPTQSIRPSNDPAMGSPTQSP